MYAQTGGVDSMQTFVGQYGTIAAAIVAVFVLLLIVKRVLRTGRRALAVWIAVAGTGGGVPGWVAVRGWLRTKGWLP